MRLITLLFLLIQSVAYAQLGGNAVIGGNSAIGGNMGANTATGPEIDDTFVDTPGTILTNHLTTTGSYTWLNYDKEFTIVNSGSVTNTASPAGSVGAWIQHTMSSANCTLTLQCTNFGASTGSFEIDAGIDFNSNLTFAQRSAYFVAFLNDTHACRLYKVVTGTLTQLGSDFTTFTTDQVTNLVVSASGTTITAKVNNTVAASVTDSSITGPGTIFFGTDLRGVRPQTSWLVYRLTVTVP